MQCREQYKEIKKLAAMLAEEGIPFLFRPCYEGYQVAYPDLTHTVADVVEHGDSYGHEVDKLEIMGLLTEDEESEESVAGYLSAETYLKE